MLLIGYGSGHRGSALVVETIKYRPEPEFVIIRTGGQDYHRPLLLPGNEGRNPLDYTWPEYRVCSRTTIQHAHNHEGGH